MAGLGWQLRTLLPGYPAVMAAGEGAVVWEAAELFGGPARLLEVSAKGLDLLVLDAPHLYNRPGSIYLGPDGLDWPDNPERFAALSWVAAMIAGGGLSDWQPEVLHGHDWQAGLAPVYARDLGVSTRCMMTIHNVAFHGLAPAARLSMLRLPAGAYHPDGFEFYGQISALKAGLVTADAITTVSPTYARELMTPQFGMGLDGVLRSRAGRLLGILNGIDLDVWDPATDEAVHNYKQPRGKGRARDAVIGEFGIEQSDGPLCIVISRLTEQKGLDLLLEAMPTLLAGGGMLALLGSGDPGLEQAYLDLAAREARVGLKIGYDEALSHRLFAGGDAVLVPSRFEPCGLTQLYGLRYGTVPVVARTGGLADTVIDSNDAALKAEVSTGIVFEPGNASALAAGLERLSGAGSSATG